MNIFADNRFIKRRINLTYLILRRHREMLAAMSYLNEDEYTPVVNEKASEKKKRKERWQVLRHLSGQRPAAVWETSDMKMRAAQPPADLSHRSRQVCPIPHSMKYLSHSILLPNCSPCILSLDLLDASLFVFTIYSSIRLSFSHSLCCTRNRPSSFRYQISTHFTMRIQNALLLLPIYRYVQNPGYVYAPIFQICSRYG